MTKTTSKPAVIVVTGSNNKGVYFGYLEAREGNTVTLVRGRYCFYWGAGTNGYVGLAVTGPQGKSKFGPTASRLTIFDVVAIYECTQEAEKKCKNQGWE